MGLRPGSDVAKKLWKESKVNVWQSALKSYPTALAAKTATKTKPVKGLVTLDKWWTTTLSNAVDKKSTKGDKGYLNKEEIIKVMKWKLGRGKFRPLMSRLESNSEELIIESSKQALKEPKLKASLEHMTKISAVGVATASAVMAACRPEQFAFMSDEAMEAVPGLGERKYSMGHYIKFNDACTKRAKELGEDWTPELVGRALWAKATCHVYDKDS